MQENAKELVFLRKGIIIYCYFVCEIVFFFLLIFGAIFSGFFVHRFGVISLRFCLRGSHMST